MHVSSCCNCTTPYNVQGTDLSKHSFLPLLERILSKPGVSPDSVDWSRIRRVLVVRQHDQLGDFILATPVFRALKESFPKVVLGVVVRDYFAVIAHNHTHIDSVIEIPKALGKWTGGMIFRLIRELRSGWDLVIVLNTVSHSVTSDLLARATGAPLILGSEVHPFPGCKRNFFYNLIASAHTGVRHQSQRNLDIVRYIGVDTQDASEEIGITKEETDTARASLEQRLNGAPKRTVVGVHIGAGKTANRWPINSFASLIEKMNAFIEATFLVFWGPTEKALAEELRKAVGLEQVFIPPSNLRELAAFLRLCDVVVCNDTGAMHLCAAVKTPLVAPFGPTPVEEWKPIGEKFVGIQSADSQVGSVTVEQIFTNVMQLLSSR